MVITSFKEPVSSSKTVNQDTLPSSKAFLMKHKMLSFWPHLRMISIHFMGLYFNCSDDRHDESRDICRRVVCVTFPPGYVKG